jgi:PleD family two-component response regulator
LRIAHRAPEAGAHVTLSVGVATLVPRNDAGADRLLGQADQALYAAKRPKPRRLRRRHAGRFRQAQPAQD